MATDIRNALHEAAEHAPELALPPDLYHRAHAARRRRRVAASIPVAAAAAVVTVVTMVPSGPDTTVAGGPTPPASTAPHRSPTDNLDGRAMLLVAADRVETTSAAAIARGAFVYTRTLGWSRSFGTKTHESVHEMWREPAGMIVVRIRTHEGGRTYTHPDPNDPKDNTRQEIAEQRATFRANGPGIRRPTPEFLASLPTGVEDLEARLRKEFRKNPQERDAANRTDDQWMFNDIRQTLLSADPIMTPKLRAAIYRVLAELDGVTRVPGQVDLAGRKGVAVGQVYGGVRDEIIFDPERYTVIGARSVVVADLPDSVVEGPSGSERIPGQKAGTVTHLSSIQHHGVRRVGATS